MIGKGNFGSAYMVTLKKPKRKLGSPPTVMAVKSGKLSDSDVLKKEIEILEEIQRTPYVIGCFGEEITVDESSGQMTYNLLLEYASGGTLADLMRKFCCHGLPESVVRVHTKCTVSGLLHERPQGKRRRVMDYLRGTLSYMPPESVVDKVQGPPSDIWDLGCVVFEMLTGKSIRSEKKPENSVRVLMSDECWSPMIPDGISSEARSFLKACFERDPVFRTTAEMLIYHPFVTGECEDSYSCAELDVPVECSENGGMLLGQEIQALTL